MRERLPRPIWIPRPAPGKIQNFVGGAERIDMKQRRYILVGVALLLFLHHDFWNWSNRSLLLGVPQGLWFHVLLCLAGAFLFARLAGSDEQRPARFRGDREPGQSP